MMSLDLYTKRNTLMDQVVYCVSRRLCWFFLGFYQTRVIEFIIPYLVLLVLPQFYPRSYLMGVIEFIFLYHV